MATEAEQLQQIESLTSAMLQAAETDDWEQAFALEAERRPLIENFVSNLPENRRAAYQERFAKIQLADHRVMELGKQHQQAIGKELGQMAKGKSAVRAYQAQS